MSIALWLQIGCPCPCSHLIKPVGNRPGITAPLAAVATPGTGYGSAKEVVNIITG